MARARFSRALAGFQVPLLSIPKLSEAMLNAIALGKSDEELRAIVASFPGVTET
jgi:hypothetical protein